MILGWFVQHPYSPHNPTPHFSTLPLPFLPPQLSLQTYCYFFQSMKIFTKWVFPQLRQSKKYDSPFYPTEFGMKVWDLYSLLQGSFTVRKRRFTTVESTLVTTVLLSFTGPFGRFPIKEPNRPISNIPESEWPCSVTRYTFISLSLSLSLAWICVCVEHLPLEPPLSCWTPFSFGM